MRLRAFDVALLVVLAPVWLLVVSLHLRQVTRGGIVWVPVTVTPAAAPDEHPRVRDFWADTGAPATDLARGDALLQLGDADLAGAGRVAFLSRAYAALGAAPQGPRVAAERSGRRFEATLPVRPAAYPWRTVPVTLCFGLAGLVALWRGGGRRSARLFGAGAIAYSLHWALPFGGAPPAEAALVTRLGLASFTLGAALFMPLLLRAALLIPERTGLRGRVAEIAPWALSLFAPFATSALVGFPFGADAGFRGSFACNLVFLVAVAAAVARNFRHADGEGRRQLKWVMFGVVAGALPGIGAAAVAALRPELWWTWELALVATVLIPICILIAILRFHFLDIDRVISATATYSLLSVLFLAGLLTLVPALAARASVQVGVDESAAQIGLAVLLAALLVPIQQRLRPRMERLFLRERFALEDGIARLRAELGSASDPRALFTAAVDGLAQLLRLDRCALYARAGDTYAAVVARGAGLPPALPADGPLTTLLEDAEGPIDAARWRRWTERGLVRGAARAAMETLGASVVVPVRRDARVDAVLCLGEKASGDVFTAGDIALLDALSDRIAAELQRFDEAAVRGAERALHEELRSYVPAVVTEELSRGAAVDPGEREVTVLFVDIRGYTGFAEGRRAEEIFRTVNTYTQEVSACVRAEGGAVVEFHGDGLMAVFGAPGELAHKERAALDAGHAIVERVSALVLDGLEGGPVRLSVGVGIATGPAFVGNIQAVDRKIWGCLGNTTNLAARLQALSRELDAMIVVDDLTRERAGARGEELKPVRGVHVRGRSDELDVWVLPRLRLAAA